MPVMVSDFPLHVAHNGANATLEAGVERFVRDSLAPFAEAAGARVVGDSPKKAPVPEPEGFTDEQIREAIQQLLDDNKTSAFGVDGTPKVRPIEKVLGGNIDAADRDRVWDTMNDG